jgi:GGDEF domain-containing protein
MPPSLPSKPSIPVADVSRLFMLFARRAAVPIVLLDGQGRLLYANAALSKWTGLTDVQPGTSFLKLCDAGSHKAVQEALTFVFQGGQNRELEVVHLLDQEFVSLKWSLFPITEAGPTIRGGGIASPLGQSGSMVETTRLRKELEAAHGLVEQYKEQIENWRQRDPETGLWGTGRTKQFLDVEIGRLRRYGRPFTVMLITVEPIGPCLTAEDPVARGIVRRRAVAVMAREIRTTDVAGILDGERLAILCRDTAIGGAMILADRVLERLESVRVDVRTGVEATARGSIAVVEASADDTVESFLARSEHTLEAARLSSRGIVAARVG